jgi:GT2 family glycosyltransferase
VSVCVTHRNRPAYLGAALDSIRDQDYPAIEVILVDDGSDEPAAIAALDAFEPEFARRGWTILRRPNRYPGAARNAAVEVAQGDYILFMDDDNLAEPHEVRTLVQAAEQSGADILTCLLSVFQGRGLAPTGAPLHIWPFLGAAIAPGMLRNVFGDANALIRRSVFDRIGGFSEDFGVGNEDWEFFARAVLRGMRLEVVPEPLVRYRQSPSGVNSSTSQHANRMRALRPYLRLLPPHLRPMAHLARQERVVESTTTQPSVRLDHVQRAVVFGSGQAGKLAIDLAERCGWSVPFLVDNNPSAWDQTAHGRDVRQPASLSGGGFDLVIVASLAGKPAIFKQLSGLGMVHGEHFVHFLDPVQVGSVATQVRL